MKNINSTLYLILFLTVGLMVGCGDDDPMEMEMEMEMENEEEEEITRVALTFTPDNDEEPITAVWFDADGEGSGAPSIDEINLEEDVTYTLTLELTNTLGTTDEDITEEILEEANEHMFFFSFTDGLFSDPAGDGNVDNRADLINYNDQDANGQPLGLSTTWTAGEHSETPGEFNVVLKHQPDVKTGTSGSTDGSTDVDIRFPLVIAEGDGHDEEEEVINQIVLTFTPTGGGDAITATWFDEDGEGVANPTIDDINLSASTEYEMSISLANTLGMEVEDITAEIKEEDDEHMFFFAFTADIFSNPSGDGNIDNRDDPLVYNDQDASGNPVGLLTNWTTGAATASSGEFRVVLKHQPDGQKTSTSDATVGGTDIDVTLSINIQ